MRVLRAVGLVGFVAATVAITTVIGPAASAATKRPAPTDPTAHAAQPRGQRTAAPEAHGVLRRNPGLKVVLSQREEDDGDDSPALSALCQSLLGQPNPYANPAPNVDQIVGDTTVTVGSQAGCSAAQNENTIAVNPANPRNLVSGANDYRLFNAREGRNDSSGFAYTSFDRGATWTNVELPGLTLQTGGTGPFSYMDAAGDPSVAFGPHNTVYYANLVFSRAEPTGAGTEAASGVAVNVSHDGGLHWGDPVLIQADGVDAAGNPTPTVVFNDKPWVGADPSTGRVYVSWTRFADDPDGNYLESPIVVSASSDFGRTFAPFHRVGTTLAGFTGGLTPFSQGSNPKVARNGTLYVAYETESCATLACTGAGDRDVTAVARSTDHGVTFTNSVVDTNFDFPFNEDLGVSTLTGENFRINSYPQLTIDPVTTGLVVTWSDDRNGQYDADGVSIKSDGDNIISFSLDGRGWTRPAVIGTAQDEVFGAVAAYAGVVAVTSYTRHYDPTGVDLDYAYWTSLDLFRGALPIHRITTQSSDPRIQFVSTDAAGNEVQGVFIGDYTGVAMGTDLRLHPNWTDFRGRPGVNSPNQDAYTQAIRLP